MPNQNNSNNQQNQDKKYKDYVEQISPKPPIYKKLYYGIYSRWNYLYDRSRN